MFRERYPWDLKVRAVCVRGIDLAPQQDPVQLTLFDDAARREKRDRVETAVEGIRDRFGKRAITYAALLGDLRMPDDGRDSVRMPGLMYR